MNTYKQLRDGTWGISGHNLVSGTTVVVTKKSQETRNEVVGTIIWKGSDGLCYATIATIITNKLTPAPPTKATTKARKASIRRSSRRSGKKSGVQEGTYSSSREGDQGDEVGRVVWLRSQGKRIPVVIVGWETGYCKEDGLSFGLPMDEGYFTTCWYRDATEEEAAGLIAKEAAEKEAKESKEAAEKATKEAAEKLARAPLEGLIRSDSLDPIGTRTPVGVFKSAYGANVSITKIDLSDGRVAYWERSVKFDDCRDYIWATEEVLASLYEAELAENPISLERSQEFLAKYSGCHGADIHRYVVSKNS